jgi:hypothetical protein
VTSNHVVIIVLNGSLTIKLASAVVVGDSLFGGDGRHQKVVTVTSVTSSIKYSLVTAAGTVLVSTKGLTPVLVSTICADYAAHPISRPLDTVLHEWREAHGYAHNANT